MGFKLIRSFFLFTKLSKYSMTLNLRDNFHDFYSKISGINLNRYNKNSSNETNLHQFPTNKK